MKKMLPHFLVVILLIPAPLLAQNDNFRLTCPLNEARVVPPPKNAIRYEGSDLCIVLVSLPDTVVKAVYTGQITNVEFDEETKHGVVMYAKINNKDYYFWYTGLNKLLVHRNQRISAGEALGFVTSGEQIELLMYQFETPVNPIKYLDCLGIENNE